jgi:imidazolonepropionase-like amidohydrolase
MMHRRRLRAALAISSLAAILVTAFAVPAFHAQVAPGRVYAIRNARIVTMAGPPVDAATIVMRDGLVEDAGAAVAAPVDAVVIDGTGLTVYPGFIDMANASAADVPDVSAVAPAAAGRAAGAGGRGQGGATLEDLERARRASYLRPDVETARYVRFEGPEMRRLASAGITSVLAVPSSGLVRGQSALINVMAPIDEPHVGTIADYRRGLVIVKSPVAQHFSFTGGGGRGGAGYPGALLGTIAFVRQALLDARWQRDARAYHEAHPDRPRPVVEPVLDALVPVLEKQQPAAFEASLAVQISRALDLAKEFGLDPMIVGGAEAGQVTAELKTAGARVIYSLNFPTPPETGRGGRGAGRGAAAAAVDEQEESMREIRARQNAPKGPAALAAAGVPFAFTSGGLQDLSLFMKNAARTVKDGGLSADQALAALTSGAAAIAGVSNRLGTLQKGRIANLVVTDGDWLEERTRIRHVFVDGRPVEIDVAEPGGTGGGRRGRGAAPSGR